MKTVPCSAPSACKTRTVRGDDGEVECVGVRRAVEVPDDFEGQAFCSLECAAYAGVLKLRPPPEERS